MTVCTAFPNPKSGALTSEFLRLCSENGLSISPEIAEKCVQHLLLVLEVNKTTNLTRITDLHEALVLHLFDSLTLLPYLCAALEGPCLDMGTGAGFPGIPLCLCSDRHFTLLDSVGKKVRAVSSFIESLGLASRCEAVQDRVESFAASHPSSYVAVTARAMSSLPVLVEYAAPLLVTGGYLIVSKGNPTRDELNQGNRAGKICGMRLVKQSSLELPLDLGHREILVYERYAKPQIALPRAVGAAKKSPLG